MLCQAKDDLINVLVGTLDERYFNQAVVLIEDEIIYMGKTIFNENESLIAMKIIYDMLNGAALSDYKRFIFEQVELILYCINEGILKDDGEQDEIEHGQDLEKEAIQDSENNGNTNNKIEPLSQHTNNR